VVRDLAVVVDRDLALQALFDGLKKDLPALVIDLLVVRCVRRKGRP